MNFVEIQDGLQKLTHKKISLAQIGEVLNLTRSNISKRAKLGSDVGVSELQEIEQHYGVNLYKSGCYTGDRINDTTIEEKICRFGRRLYALQEQHDYLDKDMAKLLYISEDRYIDIASGKKLPDIRELNAIKQHFKVSMDYLLYGE